MKAYKLMFLAAVVVVVLAGILIGGYASRSVYAQSGTKTPPIGVGCRVTFNQGVSNWAEEVLIGGITSLTGKLRQADSDWLVLRSGTAKDDIWIPRDQVALIAFGDTAAIKSPTPAGK